MPIEKSGNFSSHSEGFLPDFENNALFVSTHPHTDGVNHRIAAVAAGSGNLLYPIREALSVSATLGEICDVLRGVFGVYQPRESF